MRSRSSFEFVEEGRELVRDGVEAGVEEVVLRCGGDVLCGVVWRVSGGKVTRRREDVPFRRDDG